MSEIFSTNRVKLLEGLTETLDRKDTILATGDTSVLDISHLLSVKVQMSDEKSESKPSIVLWLDGGGLFDPYEISEIARCLGKSPKKVLKNIRIARAFTPHQMISLVSEKMWEVLDDCRARLVVITGLPSLFLDSDLSRTEVARVFKFVLKELEKFHEREEVLLLKVEELTEGKANCETSLRLREIADVILDVESQLHDKVAKVGKPSEKLTPEASLRAQSSGTVPLEKYLGGA